jgi:hypothetical protein
MPRVSILNFHFPFEEVRRYMELIFRENKGVGRLYFHGRLDVQTGKVTSVITGTASNNSSSDNTIAGESHSAQADTSNDKLTPLMTVTHTSGTLSLAGPKVDRT